MWKRFFDQQPAASIYALWRSNEVHHSFIGKKRNFETSGNESDTRYAPGWPFRRESLNELLSQPPSRHLSRAVAGEIVDVNSVLRSRPMKGFLFVFAVMFCIPVVLFFPWNIGVKFMMRLGFSERGVGRVVSYEATSQTVNDVRTYAVHMMVTAADGREYFATCYVEGVERVPDAATFPVMYYSRDPRYAIFQGARLDMGVWWLTLFLLPVVVIFCILGIAGRRKRRRLAVLRDGELALADVDYIKETNVSVNGHLMYIMRFRFDSHAGSETVERKLWGPQANGIRSGALRKQRLRLVYDPFSPQDVVLLDMTDSDDPARLEKRRPERE